MIELDRLLNVNHIVVHDNCPDGTACAMIARDVLPNAKVTFCQYTTKLHQELPAEPGMLFADFSPPVNRVQEFLDVGAIVLDHHGGPAKESTLAFVEKGLGAFADEKENPGVSGASLVYDHVWGPLEHQKSSKELMGIDDLMFQKLWAARAERTKVIQRLATLAAIRDTWQTKDLQWQQACETAEAVRWWPWELVKSTPWGRWDGLFQIGPILLARNQKTVEKCIEAAYRFTTGKGRKVTIFEGLKPSSDAAEKLGESNDLTIGFGFLFEDGTPKMIFSTRGRGTYHCRNLALAHGGGGHVKAAGFSRKLTPESPHPYEMAQQLLERYESVEDRWAALTGEPDFDKRVKNGELVPAELFESLF